MIELLQYIGHWLDKNQVPYMLTGSLAFNLYATPRSTRDIAIVVVFLPNHIQQFKAAFKDRFYFSEETIQNEIAGQRVGMFNIIDQVTGYKIDFILLKDTPYESEKFERRKSVLFEGIDLQVISAEDLLVSKLHWIQQIQSPLQMSDIQTLWQLPNLDKDYTRTWIKKLKLKTFDLLS